MPSCGPKQERLDSAAKRGRGESVKKDQREPQAEPDKGTAVFMDCLAQNPKGRSYLAWSTSGQLLKFFESLKTFRNKSTNTGLDKKTAALTTGRHLFMDCLAQNPKGRTYLAWSTSGQLLKFFESLKTFRSESTNRHKSTNTGLEKKTAVLTRKRLLLWNV